jgi:ribulose-5-phosphate 4-epimerase/fuculose-1-phosphate aldolase
MESADALREKIAQSCRILAQHGLVSGSTGHTSARLPGTGDILMRGRPKGDRGLRFAEPSSIIRVDLDGKVVGDTGGVSRVSEIYIHTEVYRRRPEVNAVVHAHPPGAVLCTVNGIRLRPVIGGYSPSAMRMAAEGIPMYERTITLQTLDETNPMLDVMGSKDVCLMRAHGVLVTGRSVEEATHRAIVLETLARMNWYASLRGDPPPDVPQEDLGVWAERSRAIQEGRAPVRERDQEGLWHYYLALLEQPGLIQYDDIGLGFGLR